MDKRIIILMVCFVKNFGLYGSPNYNKIALQRIERCFELHMKKAEEALAEGLEEEARKSLNMALLIKDAYSEKSEKNILLIAAVKQGHYKIVDMLLGEGLDPNLVDPIKELTLLQIACQHKFLFEVNIGNYSRIIRSLICCKNIKINSLNRNRTALMLAAYSGFYEAIEILLSHVEIDVNLTNSLGETALNMAIQELSRNTFPSEIKRIINKEEFNRQVKEATQMINCYELCIELLKERMA